MGINKNKSYVLNTSTFFDYTITQNFWGCEKSKISNTLNSCILGFKYDFIIFNSDFSLNYLNKCNLICSNIVLRKRSILFLIPSKLSLIIKEFIVFFSLRSLQPFYHDRKTNSQLINNLVKKSCIALVPYSIAEKFLIKKFSNNLMPFIHVENDNFNTQKSSYSVFSNNDSLHFLFFFYRNISYSILRYMLFSYIKHIF